MFAPCAFDFICTSNQNGTHMARTSCCYTTQPLKAVGLPGGVTLPVARHWRNFYQAAVDAGRGATTAPARVQLFDRIIELLGG